MFSLKISTHLEVDGYKSIEEMIVVSYTLFEFYASTEGTGLQDFVCICFRINLADMFLSYVLQMFCVLYKSQQLRYLIH